MRSGMRLKQKNLKYPSRILGEFAKGPHNPKKTLLQFITNIIKNKHKNTAGSKE
jgi:hypothetical protein